MAAQHSAGGAFAMVCALLSGDDRAAWCGTRPSGHPATREKATGFCRFNNVALAAETAVREFGLVRVGMWCRGVALGRALGI